MHSKKPKLNLLATFFIAIIGGIMPLLRNLFEVNWNFSEVTSQNYVLIALALVGFFLSFQIVNKMKIKRDTDSYYLSILGINFILTMFFILVVTVTYAAFA